MLFIWTINMLGFIPLPITGETFTLFGVEFPVGHLRRDVVDLRHARLALMTFATHYEGIASTWSLVLQELDPEVPKAMLPMLVPLEILGQFMRLVSLSVRLLANMLAGHMLILTFIGLIFVLESVVLAVVAVPAATAFYLRGRDRRLDPGVHLRRPVSHLHRLGDRAGPLKERECPILVLAATEGNVVDLGKAIASRSGSGWLARRGIGIGNIFGSMIQSVARQPELRGELTGIMWLGFALTEAVVFYGLIGGLLAFVLV